MQMNDEFINDIDGLTTVIEARRKAKTEFQELGRIAPQRLFFEIVEEPLNQGEASCQNKRYEESIRQFDQALSAVKRLKTFFIQLNSTLELYRRLNQSEIIRETGAVARLVANTEEDILERLRREADLDRATDALLDVGAALERVESAVTAWSRAERTLRKYDSLEKLRKEVVDRIRSALKTASRPSEIRLPEWNFEFFEGEESKNRLVRFLKDLSELKLHIQGSPFSRFSWDVPDLLCLSNDVLKSSSVQVAHRLVDAANGRLESIADCFDEWTEACEKRAKFKEIAEAMDRPPAELADTFARLFDSTEPENLATQSWTESSILQWRDGVRSAIQEAEELVEIVLKERTRKVDGIVGMYLDGASADDAVLRMVLPLARAVLRWSKIAPETVSVPESWTAWSEDTDGYREEELNGENLIEVRYPRIGHVLDGHRLKERAEKSPKVACFYAHWLRENGREDESRTWLERSAKGGSVAGMNNYGVLLAKEEEYGEAKTWLEKASKAGNRFAMKNLKRVRFLFPVESEV